jgi:hypothetical protein
VQRADPAGGRDFYLSTFNLTLIRGNRINYRSLVPKSRLADKPRRASKADLLLSRRTFTIGNIGKENLIIPK